MVAQLELSVRIRNRRHELGVDAKTVAQRLGFSRNFFSAIENNRALPADNRLEELIDVLEFDDTDAAELRVLLAAARERGWWEDYRKLVNNDDVLQLFGLEDGADKIEIYEGLVVTGLLQTEEYAEAIIRTDPHISRADVTRYVELRMRRQARLLGPDAPLLSVILSEGAILQEVGRRGVLRRQLVQLVSQIESMSDKLRVRVRPFRVPTAGFVTATTLVLMDFGPSHLGRAVWREAGGPFAVSYGGELVEVTKVNLAQVDSVCLSEAESLSLIHKRISEASG